MAKSYYARAVRLHSTDLRALFGYFLCASQLAANGKVPEARRKEHARHASTSERQIKAIYESKSGIGNASLAPIAEKALQTVSQNQKSADR